MIRRFNPGVAATVLTLSLLSVLLALGSWQVRRLAWKTEIIQTIEKRQAQPVEKLQRHIKDPEAWEYRRIKAVGKFIERHAVLLGPRTKDGKTGHHLLAPFRAENGAVFFVDRGFTETGTLPFPPGRARIEGYLRHPVQGRFTPDNVPLTGEWYWPDPVALGLYAGVPGISENFIVAAGRPDMPPNNHLQYAIFWFCMAFVLLCIYTVHGFRGVKA